MERLSRWRLAEALGKARTDWLESWIRWGLIPAPGPDGRWDPEVLARVEHAKALQGEGRRLSRRALLLPRDGFYVEAGVRQLAVGDVLRRLTRPSHKLAQVLWELRAMDSQFRAPRPEEPILLDCELAPDRWPAVASTAPIELFERWYQWVATFAGPMRDIGRAKAIPVLDDVPYEERVSLALVVQLLHEDAVRLRVGLPPEGPRYGITGVPEAERRRPGLRAQLPPARKPGR